MQIHYGRHYSFMPDTGPHLELDRMAATLSIDFIKNPGSQAVIK